MSTFAVIKTGGKQYLVKSDDLITVDRLNTSEKEKTQFETLMTFDDETGEVTVGNPQLKKSVTAEVIGHSQGEKIRIAKFKSKVRYRKVTGFRSKLTTVKIGKI